MTLRTKGWYVGTGMSAELAIVGAYARSPFVLIWGLAWAVGSWYYAEHLLKLEQETKNA